MLLRMMDLLFRDPLSFIGLLPIILGTTGAALVLAITIHEFSHALIANRLGDETAKRLGRLTLNPLVHLDVLGTLMLFIVGFGWGKPVPVNPYALRGNIRTGMAKVALAGPVSNLFLAALLSLPVKFGLLAWHSPMRYEPFSQLSASWLLSDLVGYFIFYNIILAVFNMIPLAPLDGFKVAVGILPRDMSIPFSRLEQYGPGILLLIIFIDNFMGTGILWGLLGPTTDWVGRVIVGKPF